MQRRRNRISERIRALKALLPNCIKVMALAIKIFHFLYVFPMVSPFVFMFFPTMTKFEIDVQRDKASILGDAIEYFKFLQMQVQVFPLSCKIVFCFVYLQEQKILLQCKGATTRQFPFSDKKKESLKL